MKLFFFNFFVFLLENQSQIEIVPEQSVVSDVVSEYVFLNHEDDVTAKSGVEESPAISAVNGDENADVNGMTEEDRPPQNGAEAYENLVKSLTECENDYMKDIPDDTQMDESFGLIEDGTILDTYGFTRESGLFQ